MSYTVRMPKGFFETLSKKCKEELSEKAAKFEYEMESSTTEVSFQRYLRLRFGTDAEDKYVPPKYLGASDILKKEVKLFTGFDFGQIVLVEENTRRAIKIENEFKEQQKITAALSIMKGAFKDV